MKAGRLRHKIVIETVTEGRDAMGGITESWATHATVRASVEPLIGKEYFAAQAVTTANQVKFRIRYLSTVTTKMRINYDSKIYDIQSIANHRDLNREMVIMGVEYVGH